MAHRPLIFYHAPHTRSGGTRILLEELRATYDLHVLNFKAGEHREPAYLAVNPMGKVPAIVHGETLVTEQVAIFLYLADLFPEKKLAPAIDDPLRGAYLRWMVYYAACFEPAVVDLSQKRAPVPPSMCPYGDFDTMWNTFTSQLAKGTYLLGERFSAADLLWGIALEWMMKFKLVPESQTVSRYVTRIVERPAVRAAKAADEALAAELAKV